VTSPLQALRARAISQTLFAQTSLRDAMHRLAFVQADPIRAPARAQDLILRQRVAGYRAGDLEREYPNLNIEEGLLYAYGFLERPLWQLRHPPNLARLPRLEKRILDAVQRLGSVHPDDLRAEFGRKRALNAWGQYSSVAKLALENLHRRGLIRVARRDSGIRVYELCPPPPEIPAPEEVFRRLVLCVANILAPISEPSLRSACAGLKRSIARLEPARATLRALVDTGALQQAVIDGETYLWPVPEQEPQPQPANRAGGAAIARAAAGTATAAVDEPTLYLLAPFDPIVWDRRRFEHLWGWAYRFEAYTPVAKRQRGYYALPMLWRERVIGWANLQVVAGSLNVELGFVAKRPAGAPFRRALEAELERLRAFLALSGPDAGG
jgi:uncharacterized protein